LASRLQKFARPGFGMDAVHFAVDPWKGCDVSKTEPNQILEHLWDVRYRRNCRYILQIKKYRSRRSSDPLSRKLSPIVPGNSRSTKDFRPFDVILTKERPFPWGFRIVMRFRQDIHFCDSLVAIGQCAKTHDHWRGAANRRARLFVARDSPARSP
jgi:hypothetical protein